MSKQHWSMDGNMFIGLALCGKVADDRLRDLGVPVEDEDLWLPFCVDLSQTISIRQRGDHGNDEHITVLEGIAVDVVYSVNAPMNELMPHFIRSRS